MNNKPRKKIAPNTEDSYEAVRRYAKEHSDFKIENDRYGDGQIHLQVTQNGSQWRMVSFVDAEEVERVAVALLAFVRDNKGGTQ